MKTRKINTAAVVAVAFSLLILAGAVLFNGQNSPEQSPKAISVQETLGGGADRVQFEESEAVPAGTIPSEGVEGISEGLARKFERVPNLTLLLAQAEASAKTGDVEALEVRARIYEECMNQVADPGFVDAQVRSGVAVNPSKEPFLRKAAEFSRQRCSGVLSRTSLDEILAAYSAAAEAGSLSARLRSLNIEGGFETISDEELEQMIASAIRTRDTTAIAELANLLGARSSGRSLGAFQGMYGSHIEGIAWEIAACRFGANCSATSTRLNQMCLVNGACGYGSIEQLYQLAGVSPADWQRVQAALNRILYFKG